MTVNIQQIQNGVNKYIEMEIAQKAVGFKKFGIYFMMPTINKQVVNYVIKFKDFIPDMFDENGNVNIDILYNSAKEAIKKSGQFEFVGIIFNETDVDKLYTYIVGNTTPQSI